MYSYLAGAEAGGRYGLVEGDASIYTGYAKAGYDWTFGLIKSEDELNVTGEQKHKEYYLPGINIGVEAEGNIIKGEANGLLGYEEIGFASHLIGEVGSLDAEAGLNVGFSENDGQTNLNAYIGVEVLASLLSGEARGGFVLLGFEIDFGVQGYAGALGFEATAGLKDGEFGINVGLAALLGAGFDISIRKR